MVQTRRVSHNDNGDDDDRHTDDSDVNGSELQFNSEASSDIHATNMSKKSPRVREHDPDDEERRTRDTDRKAQMAVKEHDSRKTLMPRVLHRSTMETSFGMDTIDSQVQHMMYWK